MAEQLIRNEQVAGSIPVTSSKRKSVHEGERIFVCIIHFSLFIIHYSLFIIFLINAVYGILILNFYFY